jgi:hypothetical protein
MVSIIANESIILPTNIFVLSSFTVRQDFADSALYALVAAFGILPIL